MLDFSVFVMTPAYEKDGVRYACLFVEGAEFGVAQIMHKSGDGFSAGVCFELGAWLVDNCNRLGVTRDILLEKAKRDFPGFSPMYKNLLKNAIDSVCSFELTSV